MKAIFLSLILVFAISCKKESIISKAHDKKAGLPEFSEGEGESPLPFSYCAAESPTGGGEGYSGHPSSPDYTVRFEASKTSTDYVNEINLALADPTVHSIFIEPQCDISIPDRLVITKPITIFSDRGINGSVGATLRVFPTSPGNSTEVIRVLSSNVRVSGFRLIGCGVKSKGVWANPYLSGSYTDPIVNVEVDNCAIMTCAYAVFCSEMANQDPDYMDPANLIPLTENGFKVHHNIIINNHYTNDPSNPDSRAGYGVGIGIAHVEIYANIFENNRHHICGEGAPSSGYDVYCNQFKAHNYENQANVDMHSGNGNYETYAGGFMHIHHNVFTTANPQANVHITGKPTVLCLIDNNIFNSSSYIYAPRSQAPVICNEPEHVDHSDQNVYGNVVAVNNIYNSGYIGWYVMEDWDPNRTDNFIRIPSTNDLLMSNVNASTTSTWINSSKQDLDYLFGDFDGDGKTDIFKSDNNIWSILPLDASYTLSWNSINYSSYKIGTFNQTANSFTYQPTLVTGHFNSDNKCDIFLADGASFLVSFGATSLWTNLNSSGMPMYFMRFGKFNRAGFDPFLTDVFTNNGLPNTWSCSFDGTSRWTSAASSGVPIHELRIGDFDGDGFSDVFRSDGASWNFSSNAMSNWIPLQSSGVSNDDLVLGDFNSDGISDVIGYTQNPNLWQVSFGGTQSWLPLKTWAFPMNNFKYGNLR